MIELPPVGVIATCLPEVGRLSESVRVTVIVLAATPSLRTLVGAALMLPAEGGGTVNAPPAVCDNTTPSVVSVAVRVTDSATRSVTVNCAAPFALLVTALAGLIFAELPALAAREIV